MCDSICVGGCGGDQRVAGRASGQANGDFGGGEPGTDSGSGGEVWMWRRRWIARASSVCVRVLCVSCALCALCAFCESNDGTVIAEAERGQVELHAGLASSSYRCQ